MKPTRKVQDMIAALGTALQTYGGTRGWAFMLWYARRVAADNMRLKHRSRELQAR